MDIALYVSIPILFLVLYITSKHLFNKLKNHPPIPFPSLPFIGHLLVIKKPFYKGLSDLSKKFGPIFFIHLGFRPILVISSPSLASECFTKHDLTFANRPSSLFGKHFGYNNTGIPWCSYGDHWRNLRKIATLELLSSNQLQILSHVRKDEILVLIRKLVHLSSNANDGVVHVKVALFEFMFNVLTGMICGKRYYGVESESSTESDIFLDLYKETMKIAPSASMLDFMPFLAWIGLNNTEKKIMLIQEKRDRYMKNLLEEHRKVNGSSDDGEKKNMAHVLLSLQKQEPEYYTDEMISNLLLVLIQSGSYSSADTLERAFSLLLDNPDVLTKAQAEMDKLIGKERLVNESDLGQLPYLGYIINETLRLHPAGPLLMPHESSKDCIVGGYDIPKGTMLAVNVWEIHHSSKVWEEPEKFIPERFEDFDIGKNECKFFPFGFGRRACPGENLALRNLTLALGSLVQCFDWEKVSEIGLSKIEPLTTKCNPRPFVHKLLLI